MDGISRQTTKKKKNKGRGRGLLYKRIDTKVGTEFHQESKYRLINNHDRSSSNDHLLSKAKNVATPETDATSLPSTTEVGVGASNTLYDVGAALFNAAFGALSNFATSEIEEKKSDGEGAEVRRKMRLGTFNEEDVINMASPKVQLKVRENESVNETVSSTWQFNEVSPACETDTLDLETMKMTEPEECQNSYCDTTKSDPGQELKHGNSDSSNNIALGDSGIDLQTARSSGAMENNQSGSNESSAEKDEDSSSSSHSHYRNRFARYNDGYRSNDDHNESSTDEGRWSDSPKSEEYSSCSRSSDDTNDSGSEDGEGSRGKQTSRRRQRRRIHSGSEDESECSDGEKTGDRRRRINGDKLRSSRCDETESEENSEEEKESKRTKSPSTTVESSDDDQQQQRTVKEQGQIAAPDSPPRRHRTTQNRTPVKTIFNWKTNRMEKARNAHKEDRRRNSCNVDQEKSSTYSEPPRSLLPAPSSDVQPRSKDSGSSAPDRDPPRMVSNISNEDSQKKALLYAPTVHDPRPVAPPEPLFSLGITKPNKNEDAPKTTMSCPRPLFSSPKPMFSKSSKAVPAKKKTQTKPVRAPRKSMRQKSNDYNTEFPSLMGLQVTQVTQVTEEVQPKILAKPAVVVEKEKQEPTTKGKVDSSPFSFAKAVKTIGQPPPSMPSGSPAAEYVDEESEAETTSPRNSISLEDWMEFHARWEDLQAKRTSRTDAEEGKLSQVLEVQKVTSSQKEEFENENENETSEFPVTTVVRSIDSVAQSDSSASASVEEVRKETRRPRRHMGEENVRFLLEDDDYVIEEDETHTESTNADGQIENGGNEEETKTERCDEVEEKQYKFCVKDDILMMESISLEKEPTYITDKMTDSYGIFRSHWSPTDEDIWFWRDVASLLDLDREVQILNVENVPFALAREQTCCNHECYFDSGRRLIF